MRSKPAFAEFELYETGAKVGNFGKYAALDELRAWYSSPLEAMGLKEAAIEQWNGDPWFALFRVTTEAIDSASGNAARSFWFKAVGEPNVREYAVTVALTAECPYWFPKLVATKPEWNGWLMEEVEGHELDVEPDGRPWALTARVLAKVQKRFVAKRTGCCRSAAAIGACPRYSRLSTLSLRTWRRLCSGRRLSRHGSSIAASCASSKSAARTSAGVSKM